MRTDVAGELDTKEGLPAPPPLTGRKRWRWVPGFLLLAAFFVFVLTRPSEERKLGQLFLHAQPAWLLVALVLQAGTYLSTAFLWKRVLMRTGIHTPVLALARLALMKLAFDQLVPSGGIGGSLVVARGLRKRGASSGAAAASVLVATLSLYAAQAIALGASMLFLWSRHQVTDLMRWLVTAFAIVLAIVPVALLLLTRHRSRPPGPWTRRVPGLEALLRALSEVPPGLLRNPRLLAEATLCTLTVFILDGATLVATLRAIGEPLALEGALVSYLLASVAETVSILPGGVGTFEPAAVGMLSVFGVPVEAALAGVLLLRGFTLWLPLPAGLFLLRWNGTPKQQPG
ncbi:lysylphosphatidylglycerol synthase transmembrane domain-containing protein [Stigmatella aurantiaca]|uniref:Integral membrane protein n=1 Tax=Stigmatella aurantiaca (strain DW4/3-1) TaxID=378806 RepID=Q092E0_STIAD|nr:lysylphosphatidylglycerol synthase transmembrane domain-containing protein [Stigmatella aurantiaca]ADO69675.1 Integral membrane protein [Stigmatella aurantiaca DW4/3-1]EAU66607.1 integral membrane protein, putative [Stigmatella aurantiaca DW4/3-1]